MPHTLRAINATDEDAALRVLTGFDRDLARQLIAQHAMIGNATLYDPPPAQPPTTAA
ncbi:hypothetical protein I6B53_06685 [Schaalia sp. 19OD2882]|nr:hypothetical protein I6B53_06685 [Schaalia sp. 19OD2882]